MADEKHIAAFEIAELWEQMEDAVRYYRREPHSYRAEDRLKAAFFKLAETLKEQA